MQTRRWSESTSRVERTARILTGRAVPELGESRRVEEERQESQKKRSRKSIAYWHGLCDTMVRLAAGARFIQMEELLETGASILLCMES